VLRLRARLLLDSAAELGEGVQLFPDGDLRWVDIPKGKIFRFDGKNNVLLNTFDHEVSKALPAEHGTIALGRLGPIAIDQANQIVSSLNFLDIDSNLRLSDGAVLPDGSLVVGVLERDLAPGKGFLVQITNDLQLRQLESGASIPNGCGLLPSGNDLVWVDSPTQTLSLLAWDNANSTLQTARKLATIAKNFGVPDGLCVDSEGGIWVAMWGGGQLVRVNEKGAIDCIVEVGTPYVTSCCFDRDDNLVITSAAVAIPKNQIASFPGAGGLWIVPAAEHGCHRQPTAVAKLSALFE